LNLSSLFSRYTPGIKNRREKGNALFTHTGGRDRLSGLSQVLFLWTGFFLASLLQGKEVRGKRAEGAGKVFSTCPGKKETLERLEKETMKDE